MLDELVRLAHALQPMRERERAADRPAMLPGAYTRQLLPGDAPEVTVLQRCCWVDEALVNDSLTIPALHESLEEVRAWLGDWHATGLWRDGRLLGMVRTPRDGTDWHIGRLGVVPDLRGLGLGRLLLHMAEAAAEPDCRRVVLHTGAASRHNIAFYESEGYRPLAIEAPEGAVALAKDTETSKLRTPAGASTRVPVRR